jgi:signal transduction histidine kinase
MEAVTEPPLESGLLRVFRVATGLRLVLLVLVGMARVTVLSARGVSPLGPDPVLAALLNVGEACALLMFLMWPGLPRRLGRGYLPVALLMASILPILIRHLTFAGSFASSRFANPLFAVQPQLLMALLVPTVIAAWQYNARVLTVLVLATALLDGGVTFIRAGGLPESVSGGALMRSGVLLAVGYAVTYLVATQQEHREVLLRMNTALARRAVIGEQLATTTERNRLARELHDTLAHTLSGLAVQLEAMRSVWDADPGGARALLDQALVTTRMGLTEARRALHDLRASPLDDLGLPLALRQLAEAVAERTGAALTARTPEPAVRFSPEVEQAVYRVAQEALENIARHADATHITLALDAQPSDLVLTVSDDGRGFDPGHGASNGLGLKGIRERAEMLGGRVEIDSRDGGPTTLRLQVPV